MKTRLFFLASTSMLLPCAAAHAEFVGLEMFNVDHWFAADHPSANVRNAWAANPGLDSYRVYAVFDSPGEVVAAYGQPGQRTYLSNITSGSFFNFEEELSLALRGEFPIQNFDVPPGPPFVGAYSVLPFETHAALGVDEDDDFEFTSPGYLNDNGGIGDHFHTNWSSDEGDGGFYSWFKPTPVAAEQNPNGLFSPNSPYALDGRYYVLLFQATVPEEDLIEGQFGVNAGSEGLHWGQNTFFTNIPTPGALGFLALAALVPRRRR